MLNPARMTRLNLLHVVAKMGHARLPLCLTQVSNLALSRSFQASSNSTEMTASSSHPCTRCCRVGHAITVSVDLGSIPVQGRRQYPRFTVFGLADNNLYEWATAVGVECLTACQRVVQMWSTVFTLERPSNNMN